MASGWSHILEPLRVQCAVSWRVFGSLRERAPMKIEPRQASAYWTDTRYQSDGLDVIFYVKKSLAWHLRMLGIFKVVVSIIVYQRCQFCLHFQELWFFYQCGIIIFERVLRWRDLFLLKIFAIFLKCYCTFLLLTSCSLPHFCEILWLHWWEIGTKLKLK